MRWSPRSRSPDPDLGRAAPTAAEVARPRAADAEALGPEARARLESIFGQDLAHVRVHAGPGGDAVARALGAAAVTSGRDVYFRSGEYVADTPDGLRLLAHEVAHTIQQGGAAAVEPDLNAAVAPADDPLEREADRAGAALRAAERAPVSRAALVGVPLLQRAVKSPPPPNMERCRDLLARLKQAVAELLRRADELVMDPHGLQWDHWATPRVLPDGTNLGSIVGHQQQYEAWRNRLVNLLDEWQDDDCNQTGLRVPQEVRDMAYRPTPSPAMRPRPETGPKPWTPPGAAPTPGAAPAPAGDEQGGVTRGGVARGALVGAAVGAALGGAFGGLLGASGGTLVAPGVGTVGGGAAGVATGVGVGTAAGAALGAVVGSIIAWLRSG
jgi:hypothetical protein